MIKGNEEKRKAGATLEVEVAVPLKHWYLSTKLHGVQSQMVSLIVPTMHILYFMLFVYILLQRVSL